MPNVFHPEDGCGAARQVRRMAMTVCMDWQIVGDPHCTALTFNYDFLGDAITHLRPDVLKLHNQTVPICTSICNFCLFFFNHVAWWLLQVTFLHF